MAQKLIRNFDIDGNELEPTYIEISDEEVAFDQLENESNEAHIPLLRAYRNYDSLTVAQKDQILKALLRHYLVTEKDFYLRVL